MINQDRYKRLRSLLHQVNRQRRRQAQQIDILCKDLISCQRRFIMDLGSISFAAGLYKSMLGVTSLTRLLEIAAGAICQHIPAVSILFYIRANGVFRQYITEDRAGQADDHNRLMEAIGTELAEAVCRSNKVCNLEDLIMLGLQASPKLTARLSVTSFPIALDGRSIGFVLLCRSCARPLTETEVQQVLAVTAGLAPALQACEKVPSN